MTDAWVPSAELVKKWREKGFDPERELAEFRNHWQGVQEKQQIKSDWNRVFENRLIYLEDTGRLRRLGAGPVRAEPDRYRRPGGAQPMNAEDDFSAIAAARAAKGRS